MTNRNAMILVVLGIVVLIAGGYLYYHQSSNAETALTTSGAPSSAAEQAFITVASELDPISFPTAIFSDPRFADLTDTRTSLTPENAGRPDPFAPLSGVSK